MSENLCREREFLALRSVHQFEEHFAKHKMIYIVTYDETRYHGQNAKRLILVESNLGLEVERVTRLVRMLTDNKFTPASVEIAGQRDWDARRVRHPAIRSYKLD